MKKLSILSAVAMALVMLASCSDDDNNYLQPRHFDDTTAPTVVSVTPADGSTELDTIESITVTYDKPIFRAPNTSIRVYTTDTTYYYVDDTISQVVNGNQLVIPIDTKPNTSYKIEILKPSVRDSSYNFAADFQTTFSTRLYNLFDSTKFDISPVPVNENATEPTKKLYSYLLSQFGKATLSGAMAEVNHNTQNADYINSITGKYPAINTFDFVHFCQSAPLNPSTWIDYTDNSIEEGWYNNGGIVSYMWHWAVPNSQADEKKYSTYKFYVNQDDDAQNTKFRTTFAVLPSKWEYKHLTRDMDIIADYLLALQAKGIPVIWRPLHEAAGNVPNGGKAWFWWGNAGSSVYKRIWQRMYTYFKQKGVNNLIWVWTSCGNDADWYPGDEYVDIVAHDYYENDVAKYHSSASNYFNELREMTGGKKMITCAECGAIPSYQNMFNDGAIWSWTMPWYGDFTTNGIYNSPDFLIEQMDSKYVITRDELPSFKSE